MTRAIELVTLTLSLGLLFGLPPVTTHAQEDSNTLKIYALTGQSNMNGAGYTYESGTTSYFNIPSMEYLTMDTPNAKAYYDSLPNDVYTFKDDFDASWMNERSDVWVDHYSSKGGHRLPVAEPGEALEDDVAGDWPKGIENLRPGFGTENTWANQIGPELGMGHAIGNATDSPVMLYKSATGGTNITNDWRPPSASGSTGGSYTNTVNNLKGLMNDLDADLADDGKLNNYNNATDYEVAGMVWLQGWNDRNTPKATYRDLLVDLVQDLRASDSRIPDDLPTVVLESADQSVTLNAARSEAVAQLNAEDPDSAVFVETEGLVGVNYGGPNPDGNLFSNGNGFHHHARAENFLELGWLAGQGMMLVPEPTSLALMGLGGLMLLPRRRSRC
jgi:hypothetical protein